MKKLTIVNYKSIIAKESSYLLEESGVWLTPRFAIRSMANATLRYQESGVQEFRSQESGVRSQESGRRKKKEERRKLPNDN
ncbi:MAG: hypothetical protein HEQ29_00625 [Dolichospermum sp. LBC05a]|nr:hypothetical protein [Dolichospermum sp. OL01]MCO5795365.1 hypothetical protein [Dolichospermum sp. OL03]MCS6281388.1 hypothetical protein [Dolichospermum sp.]QSV57084.1 MAG: hypothetical protein HEQ29_00625 [Dolichospermum sp. LBC05a]